MPTRPLFLAATLALVAVGIVPTAASVAFSDPVIYVEDAPVTRNRVVKLIIQQPGGGNPSEYRISNEGDTDGNGMLTNYQSFISQSDWWWDHPVDDVRIKWLDWTLPNLDGIHTIYAQSKFFDGTWSPVVSLQLRLDRSATTSLYVDADGPDEYNPYFPYDVDGHRRSTTPSSRIFATSRTTALGRQITVKDDLWRVSFTFDGTITPRSYSLDSGGDGVCTEACLEFAYRASPYSADACNASGGTYEISEVTFDASGDVLTLTADFNAECGSRRRIAGSIRYGSTAATYALGQDLDVWGYGPLLIGTTPTSKTLTVRNIGDVANLLGAATFSGPGAGDWSIVTDTCSGKSLAVNATCAVKIQPTPTARGWRRAYLTLPDQTERGQRKVVLEVDAVQQSVITVSGPTQMDEAGPATFVVTVAPPPRFPCEPDFRVNGRETSMYRGTPLPDPDRARFITVPQFELQDGVHTITAEYDECDWLLASGPVSMTTKVGEDGVPPTGSIAIDQDYTKDNSISIYAPAEDDRSEMGKVAFSNDGETWAEYDYQPHNAWNLVEGQYGEQTVYAKFSDAFGNWSEVVSDTVVYDGVAPTVTAPIQSFVENSTISDGKVQIRVPLTAQDSLSGVGDYDLNQKTDTGAWKNVPISTTGVSAVGNSVINRLLAPQHKYAFRVRATDLATNPSGWATGPTLNIKRFQESSTRIRYSAGWSKVSSTSLWGGAARKSTKAGASATFNFTGRAFAVVGRTGPGRGMARIYVNGNLVDTIDLYAASLSNRKVVWAESWATAVSRTIKVVVAGTAGRPLVELDAVVTGE